MLPACRAAIATKKITVRLLIDKIHRSAQILVPETGFAAAVETSRGTRSLPHQGVTNIFDWLKHTRSGRSRFGIRSSDTARCFSQRMWRLSARRSLRETLEIACESNIFLHQTDVSKKSLELHSQCSRLYSHYPPCGGSWTTVLPRSRRYYNGGRVKLPSQGLQPQVPNSRQASQN